MSPEQKAESVLESVQSLDKNRKEDQGKGIEATGSIRSLRVDPEKMIETKPVDENLYKTSLLRRMGPLNHQGDDEGLCHGSYESSVGSGRKDDNNSGSKMSDSDNRSGLSGADVSPGRLRALESPIAGGGLGRQVQSLFGIKAMSKSTISGILKQT